MTMAYPQYSLQSQDVYTFTISTLDTLPLTMPGAIQSRDLLRVLVFAVAAKLSVHQACDQLGMCPLPGCTVFGTLASQFSDLVCTPRSSRSPLGQAYSQGLGNTRSAVWPLTWLALPYHGTVDKAHQDEVCRSKAKCGTRIGKIKPLFPPRCPSPPLGDRGPRVVTPCRAPRRQDFEHGYFYQLRSVQ